MEVLRVFATHRVMRFARSGAGTTNLTSCVGARRPDKRKKTHDAHQAQRGEGGQ